MKNEFKKLFGMLTLSSCFLGVPFSGVQAEDVLKKYFREEEIKKEIETEVRDVFEKKWKAKVESIKKINIDEGYEVILKNPDTIILYLRSKDGSGKYFVLANVIADDKGRLISQMRMDQILNVKADKFYGYVSQKKGNALKFGQGKVEVYVFLEPYCSHCRKLFQYLKERQDKFTVYAFLVSFTDRSQELGKLIYCGKASLDDLMTGKLDVYSAEDLEKKLAECNEAEIKKAESKLAESNSLFEKVEARGTPFAVVNSSGKKQVIRGANLSAFDKLIQK